jgi:hypothetical protein
VYTADSAVRPLEFILLTGFCHTDNIDGLARTHHRYRHHPSHQHGWRCVPYELGKLRSLATTELTAPKGVWQVRDNFK